LLPKILTAKEGAQLKELGDFEGLYTPNDVVVLEFLQKTNFTDGGAGDAFVLRLEPDLLERNKLTRLRVTSFVHDAIGAW
jgi:hypothetical protein